MKRTVSRDANQRVSLECFMLFNLFCQIVFLSSCISPPQLTFCVKIVAAVFPGVWSVTAALTAMMAQTRRPVPP